MPDLPQSGEAERGRSRTRRLVSGLVTAVLGRGLALATPLILIPLLYRHFGAVQYGAWATVIATTSMFLWADLGLGNGLLTRLSPTLTRGDRAAARRLISTAYSTLGVLAGVLILGVIASVVYVPWGAVLGLEEAANVNPTVAICFGLLFANIPLSLVQRVQYADQQVARGNLYQMTGPVFTLVAATLAVWVDRSYTETVFVVALGPLVSSTVASVGFYRRRPELRPGLASFWTADARSLLGLGAAFLGVQVFSSIAMNADNLVAARVVSAEELGNFSVTLRLFLVLGGIITVAMLPLWPANSEALTRGDREWVRRTTRLMCLVGFGVTLVGGLSITLVGPLVLPSLLGETFAIDVPLMLGLTLAWAVLGAASPLFMVQNSVGYLKPQYLAWPLYLIASLLLKYAVGLRYGAEWIPAVGATLYALIILPAALHGYRVVLSREGLEGPAGSGRARARS